MPAELAGLGAGGATGVTLGYWYVWGDISYSLLRRDRPGVAVALVKECFRRHVFVAFSRHGIMAADDPLAPSA